MAREGKRRESKMSIDHCNRCDKRLDTDYIEYQPDGSLYCDGCLDDIEEEQREGCSGYRETIRTGNNESN